MSKTFLFSPVGGTDPISENNMRDGSMLHICRCYKPDKVYLYMSKEILDKHKSDNRYQYCLEKLSELTGWKYEAEIIERPDMKNVQEFDIFYNDFRDIITGIITEMDEGDRLLLNVSSGTPAMKSGLLVLRTLGEFPCEAIQVRTPAGRMNEHTHKENDIEALWELDEDNTEGFENRCETVNCPTLSLIKQEEIIKKLVLSYNYQAAYEIAEELPKAETSRYIDLIDMAAKRLLLDFSSVDKILIKNKSYVLPVKDSDVRKYFEYALTVQDKLAKHEYADFLRSLTPLIADLFERILDKQTDMRLHDYCSQDKKTKAWKWDVSKLVGSEYYSVLCDQFGSDHKFRDIYSSEVSVLVEAFCTDEAVVTTVNGLRKVEANLRNLAAHQIISVTPETIKTKTGFTTQQIMEMLKKAFNYAGFNIKKEYWNSYDDMNRVIINKISKIE